MSIPGTEKQIMLHGQRGNPEIVFWYRCALGTKLSEKVGILPGCCFVGKKHGHTGPGKKTGEYLFIVWALFATGKSGPKLGNYYKGHIHCAGFPHDFYSRRLPSAKIGVAVCIEEDIHFQSSGSMLSKSFRALSMSGSSIQVPARSSMSVYCGGCSLTSSPY